MRDWCRLSLVLLLLCLCYFGKYFCTSDMYIAQASFTENMSLSAPQLSSMFALGYFASMFGKVTAGALCDAVGGRFVILLAAAGYAGSTFLLSLVPSGSESLPMVFLLWACVGFFALGLAWVAVVAVATNWIPAEYLGRLMGIVSMAPQLGDAIARLTLASCLVGGWRMVLQVGAFAACGLTLPVLLFVGNKPALVDGQAHDDEKHAGGARSSQDSRQPSGVPYLAKLRVLLANPFLWVLCLLSGSLYGTRTLFLLYSTSFLSQVYCNTAASDSLQECLSSGETMRATATASSGYTLLGCVSVLVVGSLKDKLPVRHRGATLTIFVAPLFFLLAFLMRASLDLPFHIASSMVALIGFCLFGPYKVLGAVFAVDVGGKELKSTCTGLMGVSDNIFAMLMLLGKGAIGSDWEKMFGALTVLSFVSLVCATYVWVRDLKQHVRSSSTRDNQESTARPLLAA